MFEQIRQQGDRKSLQICLNVVLNDAKCKHMTENMILTARNSRNWTNLATPDHIDQITNIPKLIGQQKRQNNLLLN